MTLAWANFFKKVKWVFSVGISSFYLFYAFSNLNLLFDHTKQNIWKIEKL